MKPFRKILCPVDFSELSRLAFETAVDLAAQADGSVTLLHVYQVPALPPEVIIYPATIEAVQSGADKALQDWKKEVEGRGVPVETVSMLGAPWDVIVNTARTRGHDLIVLGTHGRSGLKHLLLGSVAEQVVRHASCSVLVARPHEA